MYTFLLGVVLRRLTWALLGVVVGAVVGAAATTFWQGTIGEVQGTVTIPQTSPEGNVTSFGTIQVTLEPGKSTHIERTVQVTSNTNGVLSVWLEISESQTNTIQLSGSLNLSYGAEGSSYAQIYRTSFGQQLSADLGLRKGTGTLTISLDITANQYLSEPASFTITIKATMRTP